MKKFFTITLFIIWLMATFLPLFGWQIVGDKMIVCIGYLGLIISLSILFYNNNPNTNVLPPLIPGIHYILHDDKGYYIYPEVTEVYFATFEEAMDWANSKGLTITRIK